MKADYQLRHQLYGQQGSLWERQVDRETRTRIRRIVKEGGNAATLTVLDQTAAGALNAGTVEVEDEFFRFTDGNFAVVGRYQRDYNFRSGTSSNGKRLHVAYRGTSAESGTEGVPTQIARLSQDFLATVDAADGAFSSDRDWYLVPIPTDLTPLMIEGKGEDVYLINGIDFVARHGYIAMTDNPADVLPLGLVRVNSAKKRIPNSNSYVLSAPPERGGSRYLAEYAGKTQSLSAFRRAAAEYAGLYVTQEADVVVDARETSSGAWVYSLAYSGAVEIKYPHTPLTRYQELPPGFVVSGQFDVVSPRYASGTNLNALRAADWSGDLNLDGILPVNGLTWDGSSEIPITSTETDPDTGKPHIKMHFYGENIERLWEFQRLHELATGDFLYTALGDPALPSTIDFWDLLQTFYGSQLCLVVAAHHSPRINTRLWEFVTEHRPQSSNVIHGIDMNVDLDTVKTDNQGIPLLDEDGNYIAS